MKKPYSAVVTSALEQRELSAILLNFSVRRNKASVINLPSGFKEHFSC